MWRCHFLFYIPMSWPWDTWKTKFLVKMSNELFFFYPPSGSYYCDTFKFALYLDHSFWFAIYFFLEFCVALIFLTLNHIISWVESSVLSPWRPHLLAPVWNPVLLCAIILETTSLTHLGWIHSFLDPMPTSWFISHFAGVLN